MATESSQGATIGGLEATRQAMPRHPPRSMRQRTSDPARQRQARFDRTDRKHPRDARLPPPRARYVGNAIGMSCRPRRRGPRFRPRTRDALLPGSASEGSTDVRADAQVAITRSTHTCSSCLMVFDLRKSSPRSDSNRRPSDYESKSLRPACAAQTRSGCSRQRPRLVSAFLTCGVTAGGMTKRRTRLTRGGPPTMATVRSAVARCTRSSGPRVTVGDGRRRSAVRTLTVLAITMVVMASHSAHPGTGPG
jgi:hypothetical protein